MKPWGYIVALAIGVLAVAGPPLLNWEPENLKTSVGFGIGVIIAAIYAWVRGIPAEARPGSPGGAPGVVVDFGGMEWYDWVVLIAAVVGGFVIGWAV
jgi:hypothetical protein